MSNRKKPAPKLTQDALNAIVRLLEYDRIDTYEINLKGYNLKGLTFKAQNNNRVFTKFVFRNADLRDSKFVGVELATYESQFEGAKLKGASFDKKTIEYTSGDTRSFFEEVLEGAFGVDKAQYQPKSPKNPKTNTSGKLKARQVVYKKIHDVDDGDELIAVLELAKGTRAVLNPDGDGKCRAEKAKVLRIFNIASDEDLKKGRSGHDRDFIYEVGKIVTPTNGFDSDPKYACGSGIHFFFEQEDAENYW